MRCELLIYKVQKFPHNCSKRMESVGGVASGLGGEGLGFLECSMPARVRGGQRGLILKGKIGDSRCRRH